GRRFRRLRYGAPPRGLRRSTPLRVPSLELGEGVLQACFRLVGTSSLFLGTSGLFLGTQSLFLGASSLFLGASSLFLGTQSLFLRALLGGRQAALEGTDEPLELLDQVISAGQRRVGHVEAQALAVDLQ